MSQSPSLKNVIPHASLFQFISTPVQSTRYITQIIHVFGFFLGSWCRRRRLNLQLIICWFAMKNCLMGCSKAKLDTKIIEAVFHASLNVIIRYISQVNSSSKTTKNTINTAVKCWMLKSIPISLDLILLSIKRSVANEHAPEMLLYQDWKQVRPIISQSSAFSLLYYQMWCICCLHYFNKKCT